MSLQILSTDIPDLQNPRLIGWLRSARAGGRSVAAFVPSASQALELARTLSAYPELSLGVSCTTPLSWARERWEVWGDGRAFVDPAARHALAYKLAVMDGQEGLSPVTGMARTLATMVEDVLAWLPAEPDARLSTAEQRFVDLALRYGDRLSHHGFVEPCEVMRALPRILAEQNATIPAVVVTGFAEASFALIELLAGLAQLTQVYVSVCDDGHPQTELARAFAQRLACAAEAHGVAVERERAACEAATCSGELAQLKQALFRAGEPGVVLPAPSGAVRRAIATGPFAEPELIVREAERLAHAGAQSILLCVPETGAAWDELAPRLAARGFFVHGEAHRRINLTPACRAFLAFASCVAEIADAARAWAPVQPGLMGPMSWWPPRAITDFMLSSISGASKEAAWSLDKRLRGNRALTPQATLDLLKRESITSHACAQAARLIQDGRIGSAAHLLARELVAGGADPSSADVSLLEAIAQMQASVARLGLSAAGDRRMAVPELVELLSFMCTSLDVPASSCLGSEGASATVRICTRAQAARLAPASADAVIFTQLTSAACPLRQADDALARLLGKLGLSLGPDPLALARHRFSRALAVARTAVVLEMSAHDRDAKPTYPAVVLAELLACYGEGAPPPQSIENESSPAAKLSASGEQPAVQGVSPLPADDWIDNRAMLVLPRPGSSGSRELSLSATQIENYLACPLKWYAQNRIKVDGIDADFTNLQKGSFAHVVLERTHRELMRRAAVSQGLIGADDPADAVDALYVPGSRVSHENLADATALLDAIFDEHLASQHDRALHKDSLSLVPHTASEKHQIDRLRADLHSALDYESTRFQGFEPRFFEQRFGTGAGADRVLYAGAELIGTIDRIDVGAHGEALVIDYKHKSHASFAKEYAIFPKKGCPGGFSLDAFQLPEHIQALAYAQVVRRLHPELTVVGAAFFSTMGTGPDKHAIAGFLNKNVAPRVMGEGEAQKLEQAMCPPEGTSFEDLLDATEERVAQALEHLAAGEISAHPRDAGACRYCPVMRCEKRLG